MGVGLVFGLTKSSVILTDDGETAADLSAETRTCPGIVGGTNTVEQMHGR